MIGNSDLGDSSYSHSEGFGVASGEEVIASVRVADVDVGDCIAEVALVQARSHSHILGPDCLDTT